MYFELFLLHKISDLHAINSSILKLLKGNTSEN
jgi:hypothetical protein